MESLGGTVVALVHPTLIMNACGCFPQPSVGSATGCPIMTISIIIGNNWRRSSSKVDPKCFNAIRAFTSLAPRKGLVLLSLDILNLVKSERLIDFEPFIHTALLAQRCALRINNATSASILLVTARVDVYPASLTLNSCSSDLWKFLTFWISQPSLRAVGY